MPLLSSHTYRPYESLAMMTVSPPVLQFHDSMKVTDSSSDLLHQSAIGSPSVIESRRDEPVRQDFWDEYGELFERLRATDCDLFSDCDATLEALWWKERLEKLCTSPSGPVTQCMAGAHSSVCAVQPRGMNSHFSNRQRYIVDWMIAREAGAFEAMRSVQRYWGEEDIQTSLRTLSAESVKPVRTEKWNVVRNLSEDEFSREFPPGGIVSYSADRRHDLHGITLGTIMADEDTWHRLDLLSSDGIITYGDARAPGPLSQPTSTRMKQEKAHLSGGTLILCPPSMVDYWMETICLNSCLPKKAVELFDVTAASDDGVGDDGMTDRLATAVVVVGTIAPLSSGVGVPRALQSIRWRRVIFDQIERLIESELFISVLASAIAAERRWCLVEEEHMTRYPQDLTTLFYVLQVPVYVAGLESHSLDYLPSEHLLNRIFTSVMAATLCCIQNPGEVDETVEGELRSSGENEGGDENEGEADGEYRTLSDDEAEEADENDGETESVNDAESWRAYEAEEALEREKRIAILSKGLTLPRTALNKVKRRRTRAYVQQRGMGGDMRLVLETLHLGASRGEIAHKDALACICRNIIGEIRRRSEPSAFPNHLRIWTDLLRACVGSEVLLPPAVRKMIATVLTFDEIEPSTERQSLLLERLVAEGMGRDDLCPICQSETPDIALICGHSFHRDCFCYWFSSGEGCPVCRLHPSVAFKMLFTPEGQLHKLERDQLATTIKTAKIDFIISACKGILERSNGKAAARAKILIFSEFPNYLELLAAYMEEEGLRVCILEAPANDRSMADSGTISIPESADGFAEHPTTKYLTDDREDILLMSLGHASQHIDQRGGKGSFSCTAAIFAEPSFSIEVEDKLLAALQPLGSDGAVVTVYRPVVENSIEDIICAHQQQKTVSSLSTQELDVSAKLDGNDLGLYHKILRKRRPVNELIREFFPDVSDR